MGIPESVQKQADAANKMVEGLHQQAQPVGVVQSDGATDRPIVEGQAPAQQQQAQPALQPMDASDKVKELEAALAKERQKFSVLQGKYNAEVPRLHQQLKEAVTRMENDREDDVEVDPAAVERLKQDYGDELIDGIIGVVRAELAAEKGKIMGSVSDAIKPIAAQAEDAERESYFARLSQRVPDWREIMQSPEFGEFLDTQEPYSGRSLRDLALEADAAFDDVRVANVYQTFKQQKQQKSDPRAALVAPQAARGTGQIPMDGQKQTIRSSEIRQFAQDVAIGRYKFRPKELQERQAEIDLAIREGRISPG